jgi:hypothetical protein
MSSRLMPISIPACERLLSFMDLKRSRQAGFCPAVDQLRYESQRLSLKLRLLQLWKKYFDAGGDSVVTLGFHVHALSDTLLEVPRCLRPSHIATRSLLRKSADMACLSGRLFERIYDFGFGVNDGAQDCRDHQCPLHPKARSSSGRSAVTAPTSCVRGNIRTASYRQLKQYNSNFSRNSF